MSYRITIEIIEEGGASAIVSQHLVETLDLNIAFAAVADMINRSLRQKQEIERSGQ